MVFRWELKVDIVIQLTQRLILHLFGLESELLVQPGLHGRYLVDALGKDIRDVIFLDKVKAADWRIIL